MDSPGWSQWFRWSEVVKLLIVVFYILVWVGAGVTGPSDSCMNCADLLVSLNLKATEWQKNSKKGLPQVPADGVI